MDIVSIGAYCRESDAVGWWEWGGQKILGGRDLKAGGTWLGCTENGRLGFLTNFREFGGIPCAKSRGDLPLKFLQVGLSIKYHQISIDRLIDCLF